MEIYSRVQHTPFFVSGPEVDFITDKVYCCREWEVVVYTVTHSTTDHEAWPKREAHSWRKCGYCGQVPMRRE